MSTVNASMTVIGAGSYGTALAITLARNGHDVVLWGHDPKHIATLQRDRCNVAFLPDVPFPDTLHLESDLATALAASRNILIVVPSHVFGDVERQYCRVISVFIRTSPYSVRDTQYANQATEKLTVATQDSRTIIQAAQAALARIWREDIAYAKAGIMLADFSGKEAQLDLFDSATPSAGSEALMAVLDGINRRGKSQLFFAGQGIDNSFAMRRQMLSPDYTTDWRSIPTATIK